MAYSKQGHLFSTLYLDLRRRNTRFEHGIFLLQLQAYRRVGANHSLALRLGRGTPSPRRNAAVVPRPATGLRGFPSISGWVTSDDRKRSFARLFSHVVGYAGGLW